MLRDSSVSLSDSSCCIHRGKNDNFPSALLYLKDMKIGIDISQAAYSGTGVANFLTRLIEEMLKRPDVEIILFYASVGNFGKQFSFLENTNVVIKRFPITPWFLDLLWNRLHIIAIENFIGHVDIFISSDWTQPPVMKGKNATILYDLSVYKYPEETASSIIATQKRKLHWVKKECDLLLCISESTKNDAVDILKIQSDKLRVIYPGI